MCKTLRVIPTLLLLMITQLASAESLPEIQRNATQHEGFVDILIDKKEAKTYLKIKNLKQDFIYQTSLPAGMGSNDIGLDRGQLSDTRLVVFERAGNTVFLRQKPTKFRAITDNASEAASINEAFASSILWGFPVIASGNDWVLVDASEFILQDIHGVSRRLTELKQGEAYAVDTSRSALDAQWTKSFPDNTELQATITLTGNKPGNFVQATVPDPYAITLKMRHSFVRLPDDNYQPRRYHPKSGFWSVSYSDYAQPINQPMRQRFIGRHRLQKLDPEAAVSAAVKPIVYYLDPGAPEPVRSALIDGALWWNQAFNDIGFKDAFQVKILPAGADPMDIRYNVIQWVHRATRGWSYGYSIADPRTGEIIKGHVTLGSLRVRQDYLIAQGLMSPFSTNNADDQPLMELALARIRQLSAHEVGHTLGINHNFAASSYGRESVMDYPHPQFKLEGGKISAPNAYGVGLGEWDKAAVAYGYAEFSPTEEAQGLQTIIDASDAAGLLYISDSDARHPGSPHARASLWDNGEDPVEELEKMVAIRRTAIENFGINSLPAGRSWADLEEILVPVYYFHRYQIAAVAKLLGGLDYDYSVKAVDAEPAAQKIVAPARQAAAMNAILNSLTPEFLQIPAELAATILPKEAETQRSRESAHGKTGVVFDPIALAAASAQHSLGLLFQPQRLARIEQQSVLHADLPSLPAILLRLHDEVAAQQYDGQSALLHQTVVDLIYSNYINLLHHKHTSLTTKAAIFAALEIAQSYHAKKAKGKSAYSGFHAWQAQRLEELNLNDSSEVIALPKMPPGSPI